MNALEEAKYAPIVGEFVERFNRRIQHGALNKGTRWVRVQPPDAGDLAMVKQDPRILPFLRVGAEGYVVDGTRDHDQHSIVMFSIGGDTLCFGEKAFLRTFVRIIDGSAWDPSTLQAWLTRQP